MIRVDDFNEEELSIIRDILFIFNGNLRSIIVRKAQVPHKTNLEALNICLCKNRENSFNCPTNCPDSKEYGIKCLYSGFFNDVDSIATPGGSIHINTPGILKSNEYPKVTYRSSVDDNSLIDASNNHIYGVDIN